LSAAESRRASIDARWTSPQPLIVTSVAAFAVRYQAKGVTLTTHVPGDLPDLWADPDRLGQVRSNLLDNALRNTDRRGKVSVTATAADDELTIAIVDTGDRVAPEHLTRLFNRFYRADVARDRQHGGAGIGLSIAKALLEAHHGHIEARGDGRGTGCAFSVTLPSQWPDSYQPAPDISLKPAGKCWGDSTARTVGANDQ
jgi:signal transduction histidine kinase